MCVFVRENEHVIWKEQWYAFTSWISLQVEFHMIHDDQVFVIDVVVTDLMKNNGYECH
jgi:hypothetical protein